MNVTFYYWCIGDEKVEESLECGFAVDSYYGSNMYPSFLVDKAKELRRAIYIARTVNNKVVEEEAFLSNGKYIHRINGEVQE